MENLSERQRVVLLVALSFAEANVDAIFDALMVEEEESLFPGQDVIMVGNKQVPTISGDEFREVAKLFLEE